MTVFENVTFHTQVSKSSKEINSINDCTVLVTKKPLFSYRPQFAGYVIQLRDHAKITDTKSSCSLQDCIWKISTLPRDVKWVGVLTKMKGEKYIIGIFIQKTARYLSPNQSGDSRQLQRNLGSASSLCFFHFTLQQK